MLNQNGGSRTDTLIKLVLVFFLSLLSFSVGTFVGKQFSDSQHKIAELEDSGSEGGRGTASAVAPEAAKVEPGQSITEEEIAKLSDEFVKKEKAGATDPAVAKEAVENMAGNLIGEEVGTGEHKKVDLKKSVTVHDEIKKVSDRIAKGEKVEAPKKVQSRIPANLPKELGASSIGKFTVQVSSHPDEAQAKTHAQQLIEKGFSAFYIPADVKGKTWYRVSVGEFASRKEALEHRTKLMQAGISTAIIQKIAK